jgi:hypothetical protein
MNCMTCQPQLSAYVDDAMGADERAAVAEHVRGCAACLALAQDLSAVRAAAGSLEPLIPPAQVWHRIAAAAETRGRTGEFTAAWLSWRPLAALVMTAVLTAGLWRVGTLLQPVGDMSPAPQTAEALPGSDPEAHYTLAIARLEEVTHADQDVLDQETAGAINAGLTVIDEAITESRAALLSEPQSESAQESLFAALRRKVALLQEMLALINEMRKGHQEGAARILSEINR